MTLPLVAGLLFVQAAASQNVPQWTITEEHRFGMVGHDTELYPQVADVAVGSRYQIYVALPRSGTVEVIDSSGHHVASIRTTDAAHGDLEWPGTAALYRDTLWVSDLRQHAVHAFDAQTGEHLRVMQLRSTKVAANVQFPTFAYPLSVVSGHKSKSCNWLRIWPSVEV